MAYLHFLVAHQNLYFDFKVLEALEYHFICAKKGTIYNCNLIISTSVAWNACFCSLIIDDSSELDQFHTMSGWFMYTFIDILNFYWYKGLFILEKKIELLSCTTVTH